MSLPIPLGHLDPADIRNHHRIDSAWQITAQVLCVWVAGLLVWVIVLHRKERP